MFVLFGALRISNSVFANIGWDEVLRCIPIEGMGPLLTTPSMATEMGIVVVATAALYFGLSSSTWVIANNIVYGNTAAHQVRFANATTTPARNRIQMAHNSSKGIAFIPAPPVQGRLRPLCLPENSLLASMQRMQTTSICLGVLWVQTRGITTI